MESEADDPPTSSSTNQPFQKLTGVPKTPKTYGKTSDLLTGGVARQHTGDSTLWVCHFCFKYMVDGVPWELHKVCEYSSLLIHLLTFPALAI